MINTNTTPQTVIGYSPLASKPDQKGVLIPPAVFTYDPATNRYNKGGDRNKAETIKGITTCAGRLTGKYRLSDLDRDEIIIDSPLRLIAPTAGDHNLIDSLLTAFTCTDNQAESEEQKQQLITWLQHAVKALYTGNQTAAPVLVFQPQEATAPASPFIVENIIKPLLGDIAAPLSRYYAPSGTADFQKLTAQGESACLLYDPAADFEHLRQAWSIRLESLFIALNTAEPRVEYLFDTYHYNSLKIKLEPIYRAILESPHGVPFLNLSQENHKNLVCLLSVNSPTLARSEEALKALATECREQLPAFLYYLLNEAPENTPAGYLSPAASRAAQKAKFFKLKAENINIRAFYKIATILILAQDSDTGAKTTSRESTFDLFRDITKAAKAYNMPLPAHEWTPEELQCILEQCAQQFPAYISQTGRGGWILYLSAIERDILLD